MGMRDLERIDGLENIRLRDDIGHSGNIQMLIRLCYMAADDPVVFSWRVDLLRRSLPTAVKDSEEFRERLAECIPDPEPRWEYRYFCGVPIGTPEHPIGGSPYRVEGDPDVDWPAIFELCLDFLEREGVTWRKDESAGAV